MWGAGGHARQAVIGQSPEPSWEHSYLHAWAHPVLLAHTRCRTPLLLNSTTAPPEGSGTRACTRQSIRPCIGRTSPTGTTPALALKPARFRVGRCLGVAYGKGPQHVAFEPTCKRHAMQCRVKGAVRLSSVQQVGGWMLRRLLLRQGCRSGLPALGSTHSVVRQYLISSLYTSSSSSW